MNAEIAEVTPMDIVSSMLAHAGARWRGQHDPRG